jgi:hypothetical protein
MAQGGTLPPNTDDDDDDDDNNNNNQPYVIHYTSGSEKTIVRAGRVCNLVSNVDGPTNRKAMAATFTR